MKRLALVAVCIAVAAAAACSKNAAEPAAAPAPGSQAAAPAAGGPSTPAEAATPAEPKKVEITEPLVMKFMDYQKAQLALVQEFAAQAGKSLKAAEGSTLKTLNTMTENAKLGEQLEEKLKAKRGELGLAEEEFEVVQDAVQTMATARALYNQMGGDAQVAKIEADQKAQLAKLPAEQRAAAEAQMADMNKAFMDLKNGLDVRKKHGDQAADVLLRHADELAKAYWEGLKSLGKK